MKFNLLKKQQKTIKNIVTNSIGKEQTREKFILKGWIESSRKTTCTKNGTRGFLFGSQTPSKMDFSAGRSMVEMLGVLAIIGVLSIGGIQGYTMAMRKYRGNEIAHLLVKYANLVYTDFYNYMVLHPDDVKINDYGAYECRSQNGNYFEDYYCSFRNANLSEKGLGDNPKGITSVRAHYIFSESEHFPSPRVNIQVFFDDYKLCKRVADSLSMFVSDYGDGFDYVTDGEECQPNMTIHKNITIEGFNGEALSRAEPQNPNSNSSYSYDNDW